MKLFLRSILSLTAITAFAPLAFGQTPLYYQGGIQLNNTAQNPTGPGDEDFNNPNNWKTTPPNTFLNGTTSVTFPGPTNIAVIQADLNDGSVFYSSGNVAYLSGATTKAVVINQTSQANSVAGFLVSNYGFVGQGSGTVTFNNTSGQNFTVNGTNAAGGDFVVDGGVTLTYNGNSNNTNSPFVVNGGTIIIGDDATGTRTTNNTLGGQGTFNVASGVFSFDTAAGNPTQMIVGNSISGAGNLFFGNTQGAVVQGQPAMAATSTTAATAATSSTVTTGSSLILGENSGKGSWSVTNGSVLQTGSAGNSYLIAIGSSGGAGNLVGASTGTLTISDNSSFNVGVLAPTVTTKLEVGTVSAGAGAVNGGTGRIVQNGTSVVTIAGAHTTVDIGGTGNSLKGGNGTYAMSGGTLLIGNTSTADSVVFNIGFQAGSTGTLTQTGGTLIEGVDPTLHGGVPNGTAVTIGGVDTNASGTGVYSITGVGTSATFFNGITLGNTGTISVGAGSTLAVAQDGFVGQSGTIGGNGTTDTGTVNLSGGTLKLLNGAAAAYTYNFAGALTGGAGTATTIDVTQAGLTSFTFGRALTGAGGINLVGSGTTVFTFAAGNTYTGSTGISGGSLAVTGAELAHGAVGSQLIFGSSAAPNMTALPGILNLTLSAPNTSLNQSITGSSGTLNVNFGAAGETLSFISATNTSTGVNIVLGANATAGALVIGSGTFGSINGSNGTPTGAAASTVEIGGNGTGGTVTVGTTGYQGLTKVDSGFNYVVSNGNLTGSVDDSAGTGNLTVAGQVGLNAGSTVANGTGTISSASILGDVTANAGTITTTTGITGNVQANAATGTITAPSITGNVVTNAGTITSTGAGIGGSVMANTGTITASFVGGALTNSGLFTGTSALGATTVVGNVTNNVAGTLQSNTPLPVVAPPAGPALPANATFTTTGALDSFGTVVVRTNGVAADSYFATGNLTLEAGSKIKLTGFGNNTYNVFNSTGGVVTIDPTTTITSTTLYTGTISANGVLTTSQVPSANFSNTTTQRNVAASLDRFLSGSIPVPAAELPAFNAFNAIYGNLAPGQFPAAQEELSSNQLQYARNIAYEGATYLSTKVNGMDADLREGYEGLDTNAVSVVTPGFESGMGRSLSSLLAYNDPGFHSAAPNGVNYYPGEAGRSSPSPSGDTSAPAPFDSSSQVISDSPNPYLADVKPGSSETPRVNEFIGGDVVLADLNQNAGQGNNPSSKGNYTAGDVTAGVSFRVTNHFAAGVLFDYNHTDANIDNNGSKTKIDTYSPGIFATYFDKGFYVNGLFSFGYNSYKNTINQPIFGTSATSSPNGEQYVTDLDFGYDFHPDKHWVVGPTLGGTYTHLDIDSFSETGGILGPQTIGSQSEDSFRGRLGGHLIYQTNTGDVLLQPNFTAMWQHEFLADSDNISSGFSGLPGSSFLVPTNAPSRDSALIGVGLTATLNNSMALYLNYMADVGANDFFSQTVLGGVKARF